MTQLNLHDLLALREPLRIAIAGLDALAREAGLQPGTESATAEVPSDAVLPATVSPPPVSVTPPTGATTATDTSTSSPLARPSIQFGPVGLYLESLIQQLDVRLSALESIAVRVVDRTTSISAREGSQPSAEATTSPDSSSSDGDGR